MLDPNSPEGALFSEFNKTLDSKHSERLRGYAPKKAAAPEKQDACEACAEGLCTEHADEDTASVLEQLVADEG
jgi:hypothetical protein